MLRAALGVMCLAACAPDDHDLGRYPDWPDAALEAVTEPQSRQDSGIDAERDAAARDDTSGDPTVALDDASSNDSDDSLPPMDGLLLWLRADDGVVSSNGEVTAWQDTHGELQASAPSADAQPSLATVAGLQQLSFDGDDELRLPELPALSTFTFIAVIAAGEQPDCPSILHLSNRADDGSTLDEIEIGLHDDSLYYETVRSSVSGPSGALAVGEPELLGVIQRGGGLAELFIGGQLVAGAILPVPPEVVRAHNVIGNNHWPEQSNGGCRPFIGSIGELLFYERALSELERADAERYLGSRWFE